MSPTREGFCHACRRRVGATLNSETEEFECDVCHGTFVEMTPEQNSDLSDFLATDQRDAVRCVDGSEPHLLSLPKQAAAPAPSSSAAAAQQQRGGQSQQRQEPPTELMSAIQQIMARAQREGGSGSFLARGEGGVELLGALQPLLSTTGATTLGDYAFGSLGTIIEQLVASDPARAPTPASKKAIAELCKTVDVAEEHVAAGWKCAIQKEPLVIGEKATTLPCGHVFHSQAIARWLSEHHSCPVCRSELPTDDNDVPAAAARRGGVDTAGGAAPSSSPGPSSSSS